MVFKILIFLLHFLKTVMTILNFDARIWILQRLQSLLVGENGLPENMRLSGKQASSTVKAIQCGANLVRLMPNIGGSREAKRRLMASVVHSKLLYASDPRTWELAVPTIDASSSLCLPHSTNLWQSSEEEAMSWWDLWWGPPAPTFWDHWLDVQLRATLVRVLLCFITVQSIPILPPLLFLIWIMKTNLF